ncbi:MAG: DUF6398 domain-containing protein [Candidatus Desulfatibia sp.]|uniref:DUF6398 domain-containing protein n=1 Tax=Candidatus Desulfatibia sp. TaxID=3101189 RepID=UPI002F315DAD
MRKSDKMEKINAIKKIIHSFCAKHLNEELESYALRLYDTIGRKRKFTIIRGKKEIWAASIIYVIARLNFLFDKENEYYITADAICDFFKTKKSTIGNKATQIETACKLGLGAEGYCSKHITDTFTFYQTPEGFIIPKSMLGDKELVVEFVDGEEAEELNRYIEEKHRIEEQKAQERKARRTEINRKIAEKKKKKKDDRQLSLFD